MPHHVVVDGSNLATEGRAMPSLAQLNEAVLAFIEDHPDALITVVVDATFGHRIDPAEVKEFDAAISNNELVAPPAGAIGRGDAFVLSIANKVSATILSNDSFQEFHGSYPWLFDEGRLVGGKPVPHIGWVFVNRVPVRGPISRTAVKEAKRKKVTTGVGLPVPTKTGGRRQANPEASKPMPVPKAPPPGAVLKGQGKHVAAPRPAHVPDGVAPTPASAPAPAASAVNDLLPFLSFVEHHPLGTRVDATVETYSSHGAYVRLTGDVVGYLPLRKMADPAPRSAREFLTIGDQLALVVESFAPTRRSIDLATVAMATVAAPAPAAPKRARGKAAKAAAEAAAAEETVAAPAKAGGRRKRAAEPAVAGPAVSDSALAEPSVVEPSRGRGRRGKPAAAAVETAAAPVVEPSTTPAKGSRSGRRGKAAEQVVVDSAPVVAAPTSVPAPAGRRSTPTKGAAKQQAPAPAQPTEEPSKPRKSAPAGAKKAAAAKFRAEEPAEEQAKAPTPAARPARTKRTPALAEAAPVPAAAAPAPKTRAKRAAAAPAPAPARSKRAPRASA